MQENQALTEREIEILGLIAQGKSNKEIAESLFISSNTVKVHVRNIFAKLEVSTRTEASMLAVQRGLITNGANAGEITQVSSQTVGAPKAQPEMSSGSSQKTLNILYSTGFVVVLLLLALIAYRISNPPQTKATPESVDQFSFESQWQERSSLPEKRTRAAAVSFQNQIFLLGGIVDGHYSNELLRFNPEERNWHVLAEKPTPAAEIQAVVLGGKIYVPGGKLANGDVIDTLEIYDPSSNRWTAGAPLPIGLSAYSSAAFEGKLYVFGGWDGDGYSDRVFLYNPDTETWSEQTQMPVAAGFSGAASAAGRLYIVGGYDGNEALSSNWVFTPSQEGTDPWTEAAGLPEGRYAMGLVSVADQIHLIGGLGRPNQSFTQMVFDPATDRWEIIENPLAKEWAHLAISVLGTEIYSMGGEIEGETSNRNLSYQIIFVFMLPIIR